MLIYLGQNVNGLDVYGMVEKDDCIFFVEAFPMCLIYVEDLYTAAFKRLTIVQDYNRYLEFKNKFIEHENKG